MTSPDRAAVIETHAAIVFFVGDRAYKLKKPVDLGFLDFRRRVDREAVCHREVELNRRLAPDVYLGVADIQGPDGEPCDHGPNAYWHGVRQSSWMSPGPPTGAATRPGLSPPTPTAGWWSSIAQPARRPSPTASPTAPANIPTPARPSPPR